MAGGAESGLAGGARRGWMRSALLLGLCEGLAGRGGAEGTKPLIL